MSALPHHPVRAALLYVLAVALFTAQDAASKWLIADYGALQIVALTKLLTLPLLFVVLPRLGGLRALRPRNLGLLVLRALVVFVSLTLFIWALAGLSLPKATTLFFVTPFFVLILSGRFLGETVSA
ncbi:MAG: EamA family transporter, partial [Alphaproteobacteria bacterium]